MTTIKICIIAVMCYPIISGIIGAFLIAKPNTKISQEIVRNIQQSTNIVEALKKENLVIREVYSGSKYDTAEIIVEYDFLFKNSKMK